AGARHELRLLAVACTPIIGIESCFQWYCTHLAGSCQGKQAHAPAEYEYARRSTRCLRTYPRLRRCAGVRQRILRVCRATGSLECLRRTHAGMSLRTTLAHAGRSHMGHMVQEAFAAFVVLDWAHAKHDVCLQATGTTRREFLSF